MRILVTGASGYIGSVLIPKLIDQGHDVTALDRFFFGDSLPENKNLTKIKADARDFDPQLLANKDAVIDLVAISNDPAGDVFEKATYAINHEARVKTATLAKKHGVQRYILPSSCSIYGFQDVGSIANEESVTNPLTHYAKANEMAEKEILPLADSTFCVTILRQATVYGYSPRMRFDLAINGMTYGAWKDRSLPLMRDGDQWRPMIHVSDTADAIIFMLGQDKELINGEIFNSGSPENVYQLRPLAERVAAVVGDDVKIEWYGDKDIRSYNVSFKKIRALGFFAKYKAEDGVSEILLKLESGELDKTLKTITLDWYNEITKWHEIIGGLEINGRMIHK
ncbi:NAD(P)-dependent oxidoreductase [Gammaproteobacteria bacterium]|nr:NAD(P)-dependent oxidoreductase [Gammaproteobacteria bacterium]MDB4242837.1 NAD(P)-dependent oxidoreductase [Gammaproteobacteria bacterium]